MKLDRFPRHKLTFGATPIEKLAGIGFEPCSNSPEEFTAQVKSDIERWGKVIRAAGISMD